MTIKTYTGWIQSFPMTCTLGVLDLASRLVSLLVPCIPAGLECRVRVPGLLIILFPTLSPILFCRRDSVSWALLSLVKACLPAFFSILLLAGSGMLWPIPWAPAFFCLHLPEISLPVTLVMSCRAPQFEERSMWCMITSSKDPKVFIGFHYFVHCGAVRRTK